MNVPSFLEARRSIRSFLREPVPSERLDALVEAACLAPAPHHSRPWRWVIVDAIEAKTALADGMGARWRIDLQGDGVPAARVDELVGASRQRLIEAPALLLGCLTDEGLDHYPDEARQRAEWGMALLSLGAGVENLMLAATEAGLASCWVAAPIFCPEDARDALELPRRGSPTHSCSSAVPTPATNRGASAGPARGAAGLPVNDFDHGRRGWKYSIVRAIPSSRVVNGFHSRWMAARPGSSAERLSSPARWWRIAGRLREPRCSCHLIEELLDARLDTRPDVHEQAAALVLRADERIDDVVDEDEIACLLAVAVDRGALTFEQLPGEDRDHAGFSVRVLARAVDVGEREDRVLEAVYLAVVVEVVDDRLLRDAIRRERMLRMALTSGSTREPRRASRPNRRTQPCAHRMRARLR